MTSPDSSVTGPWANRISPTDRPDDEHGQRRGERERRDADVLDHAAAGSARPARPAGCAGSRSRPRRRSASPDTTDTASGRNSGQGHDQRGEGQEQAVLGDLAEERRPLAVARRRRPHRDAEQDRRAGEHGQQRDVAPAPEDQPQLGADEAQRPARARRRGVRPARAAAGPGPRGRPAPHRSCWSSSLVDIEALPGQARRRAPRGRAARPPAGAPARRPAPARR